MKGKTVFIGVTLFCLVLSPVLQVQTKDSDIIQTSTGPIAVNIASWGDKDIAVQLYAGIPYAEPPVGDLRFKKTVPVNSWSETLRATTISKTCPQYIKPEYPWVSRLTADDFDEDCLYLNVWVPPNATKDSKKAVMIWIHSGDFATGQNSIYLWHPEILSVKGDVIVVQINYRLGIFGFISTDTEAPENMGFYDMLEGIKWTKRNIDYFGGDSDNITLFGHGAGSIAIGLMCLSPLAKGLFQRAILQSGSPAYPLNDNRWKNSDLTLKVAKAVGCVSDTNCSSYNPTDVIRCLRTKDMKQLVEQSAKLNDYLAFGFSSIVGDEFMPTEPRLRLIEGYSNEVDIMIGHTQDEGSYLLAKTDLEYFGAFGRKNSKVNKTFAEICIKKAFKDFPTELVVQHYLGGLKANDYKAIREQTYHAIGDFFIVCPDTYFAEMYSDKTGHNVYAYYFNNNVFGHPYKPREKMWAWAPWMGSVHSAEIDFVFGAPLTKRHKESQSSKFEIFLSQSIINMWTNFAKSGNPGENWQKFTKDTPYFKEFNYSRPTSYLKKHQENCNLFRPYWFISDQY